MSKADLERVARALAREAGHDPDQPLKVLYRAPGSNPNFQMYIWQEYEPMARAAIEAIRVPSEAMRKAGWTGWYLGENDYEGPMPEDAWTAMIDEILKEEG